MDSSSGVASSSPAPSPLSSVFSYDAASSQSSATSVSSITEVTIFDSEDVAPPNPSASQQATFGACNALSRATYYDGVGPTALNIDDEPASQRPMLRSSSRQHLQQDLPISTRQNPRRTRPQCGLLSHNGGLGTSNVRPPPSLVRQDLRKDNFVDGLVETTTQTIEAIWPLSKTCQGVANGDQKLIPLRTFVQEVLKRSRTSYSTLLVALHYLIVVMAFVLKYGNFAMEQVEDSEGCRAMQCGRRMFLAALVLASKYLQDRNFSTRAWGKISGLQVSEINTNERVFLAAVNWKLHIPDTLFQRWERVVLKYSPSASSSKTPRSCPTVSRTWQSIIPQLNPELDQFDDKGALISDNDSGYYSSSSRSSSRDSSPHAIRTEAQPTIPIEPLPTNSFVIPRCLEPKLQETSPGSRMLPPLQPREGPLPTPTFTPRNSALCTPAVSASGLLPGTSSMAMAMAQSRKMWDESLLDKRESFSPASSTSNPLSLRRSSRTSSGLSQCLSSPDSVVWDQSSNPSRSSSISSVASSTSAASRPDLAWQAMHRCANMQSSSCKNTQTDRKPSLEGDLAKSDPFPPTMAMGLSNCDGTRFNDMVEGVTPTPMDFEIRAREDKSTPSTSVGEATPRAAYPNTPNTATSCQKTYEAAVALCELDLGRKPHFLPRPQPTSNCRSRKRERPRSTDVSLQWSVRDLVRPRESMPSNIEGDDDAAVLPDTQLAESSFLRRQDGSVGHDYDGAGHDLRWLAAAEVQAKFQASKRAPMPVPYSETETDSGTSGTPRKKTCMLARRSSSGQGGLSVRRGGGNTTPLRAEMTSTALKDNQKPHARFTSNPSAKSSSSDHCPWIHCFRDTRTQVASAELDRMLRVSRGESRDDRPASRGGKLWGEIL